MTHIGKEMPLGSDRLPCRETGPWVHDKNFYVDRYLSIFSRGVGKKWMGNLAYVDLFAGPGRNMVRDTRDEVEGSPLLALRHEFGKYVFVDLPEILRVLEARLQRHPKRHLVQFVPGDCNELIHSIRGAVPPDYLTLAFVDPTGIQIQFRTLRKLASNRKMDLLMTIQLGMGIKMNLPQYSRAEKNALTEFMGDSKWKEDYAAGGAISQIGRRILNRYLSNLKRLGYRTIRDRDIAIRSDQRNLLLYVIVLASRHPLGGKLWEGATEISPSGQRRLKGLDFGR